MTLPLRAALVAAIVLSAVPAAAAAPADPCTLLRRADIGNRLGKPLTAISPVQNGFSGESAGCDYFAGPIRFVKLRLVEGTFAQHVKSDADFYHEAVKPLHGIGDEAAFVGPFLWVRKHDVVMSIVISTGKASGTPRDLPITEQLARAAVSRLR